MNAVVTICANNYLGNALTLCNSLYGSNIQIYVVLADGLKSSVDYSSFPYSFIDSSELGIPNIEELAFKYNVVEFCTFLKPFALSFLLEKGFDKAFYLDPDICFYDSFDRAVDAFGDHSIMLTPHITEMIDAKANAAYEKAFLQYGDYNLGFIGVSETAEAKQFLKWWEDRLISFCFNDNGYYTDQKWINLVPSLFDNYYICKDKSFNCAPWNFCERRIERIDGSYYVASNDGYVKLLFYHFSGYKGTDVESFLLGTVGFETVKNKKAIIALFEEYREKLLSNKYSEYKNHKYSFGFYDNGMPVIDLHRRIFNQLLLEGFTINNPFSTAEDSFYMLLEKNKLIIKKSKTFLDTHNASNNQKTRYDKRIKKIMRCLLSTIRIDYYNVFLKQFCKYASINNQAFLIKRLPNNMVIGWKNE